MQLQVQMSKDHKAAINKDKVYQKLVHDELKQNKYPKKYFEECMAVRKYEKIMNMP